MSVSNQEILDEIRSHQKSLEGVGICVDDIHRKVVAQGARLEHATQQIDEHDDLLKVIASRHASEDGVRRFTKWAMGSLIAGGTALLTWLGLLK